MEKTIKTLDVLSKVGSIIIPILIFYFGYKIQQQQNDYNKEQQKINRVTSLLKSISSENENERNVAFAFSKYLVASNDFPNELVPVFEDLMKTDTNLSVNAQQVLEVVKTKAVSENNVKLADKIEKAIQSVTPRIYIHISKEEEREKALILADSLKIMGFIVPGIEKRDYSLKQASEFRYFKKDEREKASEIVKIINDLNSEIKMTLKYISGYENSTTIRQFHFEIWLDKIPH